MRYVLEIYHKGEAIETRALPDFFISPAKGEVIYIEFQNPSYHDDPGPWLIVKERRHLFLGQRHTLQLFCEPDPNKGEHLNIATILNRNKGEHPL